MCLRTLRGDSQGAALFLFRAKRGGKNREPGPRDFSVRKNTCGRFPRPHVAKRNGITRRGGGTVGLVIVGSITLVIAIGS